MPHKSLLGNHVQEVSCFGLLTDGLVTGRDYVIVGGAWDTASFQVREGGRSVFAACGSVAAGGDRLLPLTLLTTTIVTRPPQAMLSSSPVYVTVHRNRNDCTAEHGGGHMHPQPITSFRLSKLLNAGAIVLR